MADPMEQDVYTRLGLLWSDVVWGWLDNLPSSGVLQQILRENLSEEEARVLSEIPLKPVPLDLVTLDEIAARSSLPREEIEQILDRVVARNLLFSRPTEDGKKAYALLKTGYGYPQTFFWKGEKNARAQRMVHLQREPEYLKAQMDLYTRGETKPYRYVPVTTAIDPEWQNVYPTEAIEKVIKRAKRIAVAHCPCRIRYEIVKGESCGHSTEVCMKFDDLADILIGADLAREISQEEALEIIRKADAEGLVHFTDNTGEGIKHICNCCGDACWNVRPIRLRQIPRDVIMATYFVRQTDEDECIACGNCVEICPVEAVKIVDDVAKVDRDWCIGCGVCVPRCSTQAIKLVEKEKMPVMSVNFDDLHVRINNERAVALGGASEG
ncbi:MAG: 4Fe-4S binding protein [Chloroflexi bacterium]|nr:4Fe-4S binding protein [Chloroflexota bacterium]